MAAEALNPFFEGTSGRNTRGLLRVIILCTIAGAAVASRLFSVIREYPFSNGSNATHNHLEMPIEYS